jgi:4-hydroxybenzoate polyprenyltransferase
LWNFLFAFIGKNGVEKGHLLENRGVPLSKIKDGVGLSHLKLFLALSRTPHGLLDMAAPGLAALLWLGTFPPLKVTILGLITAFAGYTAVYALNDLVDRRVDREKIKLVGLRQDSQDLDNVFIRHPLAHGLLSFSQAMLWAASWGLLALVGAYVLNPICALIFLLGCFLEAIYCLLLRISSLRTLVSGVVKSLGGIAAVFAVDARPDPWFLVFLLLWLVLWEIGGQNVPNDWADLDEDKYLQVRTVPLRFGTGRACAVILGSLGLATILSLSLYWITQADLKLWYLFGASVVGLYVLLIPAFWLFKTQAPERASILFNRASYYPMAMLVVVVVSSGG